METIRLGQFHTLYQTSNLRKASELLGISPSGLSKSMKALQEELQIELFFQSGRSISFTDKGHELAQKIPKLLDEFEKLVGGEEPSGLEVLKIGSFEVFTTYFCKILESLFNDYELDFHELVPGKMEKALLNRDIDVALTYEPIAIPQVEHLRICEIEMGVFVRKGSFTGKSVLDIPFAAPLIPIEGSPSGLKGLDGWPDHKIKRKIKYRVDLMETAISLCRQGNCAVFIPTFVAKLHNEVIKEEFQLIKRALPKTMRKVKRSVYLVKRESTLEDSKVKRMAKLIRTRL